MDLARLRIARARAERFAGGSGVLGAEGTRPCVRGEVGGRRSGIRRSREAVLLKNTMSSTPMKRNIRSICAVNIGTPV